jgi:hypothetical protein
MRAVAALVLLCAVSLAQDSVMNKRQFVSAQPANVTAVPGKTASATFQFRINPGMHINSSKPSSELLIPTKLRLESTPEIKVGRIAYPPGHPFAFSFAPEEKLDVYSGDVTLNVPVTPFAKTKAGSYSLKGELTYQACDNHSCFPPKELPVAVSVTVR